MNVALRVHLLLQALQTFLAISPLPVAILCLANNNGGTKRKFPKPMKMKIIAPPPATQPRPRELIRAAPAPLTQGRPYGAPSGLISHHRARAPFPTWGK